MAAPAAASRYAPTDLNIAGIAVRAGELVLLDTGRPMTTPPCTPQPDWFDVSRQAPGHVCFGHPATSVSATEPATASARRLARIELEAVFTQLIQRFPNMRLAVPPADLAVNAGTLTGGLHELPVTW